MKYPEPKPVNKSTGISENTARAFMQIMCVRDDVTYTSYTMLNFSRPAVCLSGNGVQKTVTVDNIKAIMREERPHD